MTIPDAAARADGRAPPVLLAFLALLTSIVALTIDAVLPVLDAMDAELGFAEANDRHFVVMAVFAGLALAQAVVGPLGDAYGRRAVALGGLGLYIAASLAALVATDPEVLIAARFAQGLGAGGPRVMSVAIVRDLYSGRPMARVMSLVNTVFMAVPLLAPLAGQAIEALGGWRAIFGFYALAGGIAAFWYIAAVPETLPRERRVPLSLPALGRAYGTVLASRQAMTCTGVTIAVFGSFVAYLATAQQIFEEVYDLGAFFPLAFATLALTFAVASFTNGRLVLRLGMRRLSGAALFVLTGAAMAGFIVAKLCAGVPPLWLLLALLGLVFMAVAVVFANMIALATEPLGHVAGTATAFVLAASTLGSSLLATLIAQRFDGTVTPLFAGFSVLGLVAVVLFRALPAEVPGADAEHLG